MGTRDGGCCFMMLLAFFELHCLYRCCFALVLGGLGGVFFGLGAFVCYVSEGERELKDRGVLDAGAGCSTKAFWTLVSRCKLNAMAIQDFCWHYAR